MVVSFTKFKITTLENLIKPCLIVPQFKHEDGQIYANNSKHFIQRKHDNDTYASSQWLITVQ
jgi:hypothetical protein